MDQWEYNIQFEMKAQVSAEVRLMVMDKYPAIEKERNCALEKHLRNAARESYGRKLLIQQGINVKQI